MEALCVVSDLIQVTKNAYKIKINKKNCWQFKSKMISYTSCQREQRETVSFSLDQKEIWKQMKKVVDKLQEIW